MPRDRQYRNIPFQISEIEHGYGERVHLLADPHLTSLLARIGRPDVHQPLLNSYFQTLYAQLLSKVVGHTLPRSEVNWETRMKEFNEKGVFCGEVVEPETPVIVVNLARAGALPSHICYSELNLLLDPQYVRQDHFYLNRQTNQKGEVVGVNVSGSKIGGGQEGAFVFFPDPMGATGGSLSHCIDHYKKNVEGRAQRYMALHIIITPEYIKRMQRDHPDIEIFAVRLDRGLSSPEVLETIPGTFIDQEKGLNEKQYIVPGAGGIGEVLNNSFV